MNAIAKKDEPDNLSMWNRLMPTDPKYTKQFDREASRARRPTAPTSVLNLPTILLPARPFSLRTMSHPAPCR